MILKHNAFSPTTLFYKEVCEWTNVKKTVFFFKEEVSSLHILGWWLPVSVTIPHAAVSVALKGLPTPRSCFSAGVKAFVCKDGHQSPALCRRKKRSSSLPSLDHCCYQHEEGSRWQRWRAPRNKRIPHHSHWQALVRWSASHHSSSEYTHESKIGSIS